MTYVFINQENPYRIKMIEALGMAHALLRLEKRLVLDINSGLPCDYKFGYLI